MYQNISQICIPKLKDKILLLYYHVFLTMHKTIAGGMTRYGKLYFYSPIYFSHYSQKIIFQISWFQLPRVSKYHGSNCPDTYPQDNFLKSGHGPVFLHRLPQKGNLLPKSLQERIPGKLSNDLPLNCELP